MTLGLGVSGISFAIEFLIFFVTGFFFALFLSRFLIRPFSSLQPTHYINIIEFHAIQSLCHVDKSILGVHGINDLIMRSVMTVYDENTRENAQLV